MLCAVQTLRRGLRHRAGLPPRQRSTTPPPLLRLHNLAHRIPMFQSNQGRLEGIWGSSSLNLATSRSELCMLPVPLYFRQKVACDRCRFSLSKRISPLSLDLDADRLGTLSKNAGVAGQVRPRQGFIYAKPWGGPVECSVADGCTEEGIYTELQFDKVSIRASHPPPSHFFYAALPCTVTVCRLSNNR